MRTGFAVVAIASAPILSRAVDAQEICADPWRIEETFRLTVERGEAAPSGIQDVELDEAGRIYVIRFMVPHISVFAPDGRFLRTIGEPGSGPGQFGLTPARQGMGWSGEALWVSDFEPGLDGAETSERITIFGSDGTPVAHLEVPPDPIYGDLHRDGRPLAISSREVVRMIAADALGVERVLVFEIVR